MADTVGRIEDKPEKILADPKQHDAGDDAGLKPPGPFPPEQQRKMKHQRHEWKDPGMISGHGASTPKDIQQPMMLDSPGG